MECRNRYWSSPLLCLHPYCTRGMWFLGWMQQSSLFHPWVAVQCSTSLRISAFIPANFSIWLVGWVWSISSILEGNTGSARSAVRFYLVPCAHVSKTVYYYSVNLDLAGILRKFVFRQQDTVSVTIPLCSPVQYFSSLLHWETLIIAQHTNTHAKQRSSRDAYMTGLLPSYLVRASYARYCPSVCEDQP